ncbi:hypothetical protein CEG14_14920 [Bordetella genomosp. 1]|uniref:Uncharacterized protein n=1 Tax=Bordetella genomosp. 1 TaxID=1395607 RepID=A0A261SH96_9BORD|nr:hypothetical protein CEG14_14920 [Bordetella genomosp. 1]
MQRQKGAAFERTVSNMLTEATGTTWRRRVRNQANDSDVIADNPAYARISIECKHANTLALPAWWRQAQAQAGAHGLPVLIFRKTGGPIRVMVDAHHINSSHWPVLGRHTITLEWEPAMQWLREKLPTTSNCPGII